MKYIIRIGIDKFPIKSEEVDRVIRAMSSQKIVVLDSGIFNGKYITGITKDINSEKGWNFHYVPTATDSLKSSDFNTDLPEKVSGDKKIAPKTMSPVADLIEGEQEKPKEHVNADDFKPDFLRK